MFNVYCIPSCLSPRSFAFSVTVQLVVHFLLLFSWWNNVFTLDATSAYFDISTCFSNCHLGHCLEKETWFPEQFEHLVSFWQCVMSGQVSILPHLAHLGSFCLHFICVCPYF